jgi:enoyl-CoA hydratase/carnithine racemase
MEVKWGLIPDMSGSQTLRDLVRLDVAKELVFTGRIVEAHEARELGLVTRVDDEPLKLAFSLAEEIATKNPEAVSLAKKLLEDGWHGDSHEGLKLEEDLQKRIIGSPNQMEAVRAGMAKEEGNFSERGFGDYTELG